MIEVDVYNKQDSGITTNHFQTPYNALRYMQMIRGKGYVIASYRCDDPYEKEWLDRRIKL